MDCEGKTYLHLYCNKCGNPHVARISCGDRTCPSCRSEELKRLKKKYTPFMKKLQDNRLVFVTLTRLVKAGAYLRGRIKETKKKLQKLFRQKVWKNALQGGLYTVEVKWSDRQGAWNIHIHAVAEIQEGTFRRNREVYNKGKGKTEEKSEIRNNKGILLDYKNLSKKWRKLTGDSYIVDIKPVRKRIYKGKEIKGSQGVMGYILKYLNKEPELGKGLDKDPELKEEREWEYNLSLKGQRMIQNFGTWNSRSKKYRFAEVEKEFVYLVCGSCGAMDWTSEFETNSIPYFHGEPTNLYRDGPVFTNTSKVEVA